MISGVASRVWLKGGGWLVRRAQLKSLTVRLLGTPLLRIRLRQPRSRSRAVAARVVR